MTEGVDSGKTPRRTHDRLRKLLHGVVGDETRSGAPASGAQTVAARRREAEGQARIGARVGQRRGRDLGGDHSRGRGKPLARRPSCRLLHSQGARHDSRCGGCQRPEEAVAARLAAGRSQGRRRRSWGVDEGAATRGGTERGLSRDRREPSGMGPFLGTPRRGGI